MKLTAPLPSPRTSSEYLLEANKQLNRLTAIKVKPSICSKIEVFLVKEPSAAQDIVDRHPINTMQPWDIWLIPVTNI
ncbi:hypothetical protein BRL54_06585 [Corynebacterium ulcerans]|nr:hypothetical protein BRL54_06585 [Corynebacterium ulcerans]